MHTVYNDVVQSFIKENSNKATYEDVKIRIADIKNRVNEASHSFESLFTKTKQEVLNKVVYATLGSGVWVISAETLAKQAKCSVRSVYSTVSAIKKIGEYEVCRLANGNAGKYVFVDKYHTNYVKAMYELFNVTVTPIFAGLRAGLDAELDASLSAGLENPVTLDTPSVEGENEAPKVFKGFKGFKGFKKQALNNCFINLSKPTRERASVGDYYMNVEQLNFVEYVNQMPFSEHIKSNGEKLALRLDMFMNELNNAKVFVKATKVLKDIAVMELQGTEINNVIALFTERLDNELKNNSDVLQELDSCDSIVDSDSDMWNWLIDF